VKIEVSHRLNMDNTNTDWKPLLLERASIDTLRSDTYRRFILETAIVPGCRLLLARHRRHPAWPYVDTKFNPNTGEDLPPRAFGVVYTWFLGRGSEALDEHLRVLDGLDALAPDERIALRRLFAAWIANMTGTIITLADRYGDRIPFRVNRDLRAVLADGTPAEVDTTRTGAGDLFCAKGLMSSADPAVQRRGLELFHRCARLVDEQRVDMEQTTASPGGRSHGMFMLFQGAATCFARKAIDPAARHEAINTAARFLALALDVHYDPATAIFSEYVDAESGQRGTVLDPGHANELVGLGLCMLEAFEQAPPALQEKHGVLLGRARRELPRLLIKSMELGYNRRHPGLFKTVDNRTGVPIDTGMPWWNLPETMRAAVRAAAVAETEEIRQGCLEAFRLCHNAYFTQYLNRANMLFPYQTLDGATGHVVDTVPAVPEGDPLYHANTAFLDMLDVMAVFPND